MKILTILLVLASGILIAGCGEKAEGEVPKGAPPVINDKNAINGQQGQKSESNP